ncbi:MAG: patatin-like phospholipase family protein, partial [Gammaproteobacteria bacterium]|nr:patatin-like phospholipase family protein [Gammaproteobacteria bacterium]
MTYLRRWRLPSIVTLFLLIAPAMAEDMDRPKVGLVLGGGGARGAAHIGVLRELERMRIPVDAIAGTSMGAIVGGLYATGMSAAELEELVSSLDWAAALTDEPNRRDMSFRRKQDDAQVPIDFELGIRDNSIVVPKGVIQGQELDLLLRKLTLGVSHIDDFDSLPVPFRAIASDIEKGEAFVMERGDLAQSIRASMSVPAVFAPVRIDGRLLVDGGLVRNLPVDVMQAMDVDVIIAVDVEFPLYGPDELDSAVAITEQMMTILMRKETTRQIERLNERDILIQPDLGLYASSNFDEISNTVGPGQDAAREQASKLQTIALDEAAWEAYMAERVAPVSTSSHLAFVDVKHDGALAPEVLESRLTVKAGDPIDHAVLATNADRLYGLQLFEQVSYRLVETEEGTGAEYRARTKSWGPNILQFGVALEDDFEGSTGFNVSGRITRVGINKLGAEWRNDIQLGTDPKLFSEFYQP